MTAKIRNLLETQDFDRIVVLGLIMVAIVIVVLGGTLYSMYRTALTGARHSLVEKVKSQARLFEAVNRYDTELLSAYGISEKEALEASLEQLRDAHSKYEEGGKTDEFMVAKHEGGLIVWLLQHRHSGLQPPTTMPWDSTRSEPMRRALSGQSGVIIAPDYRGETVLAAYEPVRTTTPLGIVAKIDLSELKAPFIQTGVIMILVSSVLVAVGLRLFYSISQPIISSLRQSEAKFRTITEMSSVAVYMTDKDGKCIYVNPLWMKHAGLSMEEAKGDGWSKAIHKDDREIVFKNWDRMVESGGNWGFEYRFYNSVTRKTIWVYGLAREIRDVNDVLHGYVGVNIDITKRKMAQHDALEKDVLLREVHHRVKNNLATIISLLNLKVRRIEDDKVKEVLIESRNRIHSMALIHNTLYQSGSADHIELTSYVRSLGQRLITASQTQGSHIQFHVNIPANLTLPIEQAVPIGLIINELITNSIKYAMDSGETIAIEAHTIKDNLIQMTISDDGPGLKDIEQTETPLTFGLGIVSSLVTEQLEGTIRLVQTSGTCFEICWPVIPISAGENNGK